MKHVVFVVSVTLILAGFAPQSQNGIEHIQKLLPHHGKDHLRYYSGLIGMTGVLIGSLLLLFVWIPFGNDRKR